MVNGIFVQYNDVLHRDDFYQLNLEYLSGLDQILTEKFNISVNPEGSVQEYLDSVFTKFTELEPPVGARQRVAKLHV